MTSPPSGLEIPLRRIIQAEALAWLRENPASFGTSVVTSLPDTSELPELAFEAWRDWFIDAARAVLRWVPKEGVAIFFQSDIRYRGYWIDKGYLVMRAAEIEGIPLIWHKVVCRHAPGTITQGRASYSHLLCFARSLPPGRQPGPDVLPDAGMKPWPKAMGVEACRLAVRYLREETETRLVVDPFCGHGTLLAVANAMGMAALGVDISARKCRAARRLQLNERLELATEIDIELELER